jgi:hypothetical protein
MPDKLPINLNYLLRQRTVEGERIEYKAGWTPGAILRTLCAFANDFENLGGGYVVIGKDFLCVVRLPVHPLAKGQMRLPGKSLWKSQPCSMSLLAKSAARTAARHGFEECRALLQSLYPACHCGRLPRNDITRATQQSVATLPPDRHRPALVAGQ